MSCEAGPLVCGAAGCIPPKGTSSVSASHASVGTAAAVAATTTAANGAAAVAATITATTAAVAATLVISCTDMRSGRRTSVVLLATSRTGYLCVDLVPIVLADPEVCPTVVTVGLEVAAISIADCNVRVASENPIFRTFPEGTAADTTSDLMLGETVDKMFARGALFLESDSPPSFLVFNGGCGRGCISYNRRGGALPRPGEAARRAPASARTRLG